MKEATVPAPAGPGEGDYEAARRFDKSASDFAKSGKVARAARDAKPRSAQEEAKLREAEREGLSHSKGEDPTATPSKKPR